MRVEDHEVPVLLRKVVGDRQPGLSAADDDGVEDAAGLAVHVVRCLVHGPDATAAPRGPRRVDPPFARKGAGGFHPGAGQSASPCRKAYAVAADLDETASLPKMLLR